MLRENTPELVAARLAAPQAYLVAEFEKAGLSVEEAGKTLLSVMYSGEGKDRVAAVELFLAVTFGNAPTRSRNENINANVKPDRFFEPAVFENPPPVLGAPTKSLPAARSPRKKVTA